MRWKGGSGWGVEEVRRSEECSETGEQAREGVMSWDKGKVEKGRKERETVNGKRGEREELEVEKFDGVRL